MSIEINELVASAQFADRTTTETVMVLLHGYGSHERDLPPIVDWLDVDVPWVSLRAPLTLSQGGFAWAPISVPGNPDAEDTEIATDMLWRWLDEHLPANPLVAIGFSQGGFMVSQLLRTRPSRVAKAALLAGFVSGSAQPADDELLAIRPTVFWSHGTEDAVIVREAVERTADFLRSHTTPIDREYEGLGHSIDQRVLSDLREYLVSA